MSGLRNSFAAGYDCLAAAADLVDRINVFPVADGDTGTNLRISLAPLRRLADDRELTRGSLARSATGNSGNIAAAFFREFCLADSCADLANRAALGRDLSWRAVASPRTGTMLSVFDSLVAILTSQGQLQTIYPPLCLALQKAVRDTTQLLPDLGKAGVVDSGALAMYVFFDGFYRHLTDQTGPPLSHFDLFPGRLAISSSFRPELTDCHCIDAVIDLAQQPAAESWDEQQTSVRDRLAELGKSVVVVQHQASLKIHIHTPDPGRLRRRLGAFGQIVQWSDEAINQSDGQPSTPPAKPALHIVTDAAGSLTRAMARRHGITLLDSYIIVGDDSRPESLYSAEELYPLLRRGVRITTAQASTFERHQHYRSLLRQFGPCLYLCVGAAFTGNYGAAVAWQKDNGQEELFTVIDTGAASGRLALIALLTARQAERVKTPTELVDRARRLVTDCVEYVFINELKYLAAGGRVSKAGGFFGDLLSVKPVVSPTSAGVRKVGVVRSVRGQLAFALARLAERFDRTAAPTILLQFSDNEAWVTGVALRQVGDALPGAEILLAPLSLTSGVHMGPGTWSMAVASPLPT